VVPRTPRGRGALREMDLCTVIYVFRFCMMLILNSFCSKFSKEEMVNRHIKNHQKAPGSPRPKVGEVDNI
jgi:hypothetical protein